MTETTPTDRLRHFLAAEQAEGADHDTPLYDEVGYDLTYGDLHDVLDELDRQRDRVGRMTETLRDIAPVHEQLAAITQQLRVIFQAHAVCATCAAEARQAGRPNMNFINVIIDGTGYCHEHVDLVNGRLRPKSSSGLIVAGGMGG